MLITGIIKGRLVKCLSAICRDNGQKIRHSLKKDETQISVNHFLGPELIDQLFYIKHGCSKKIPFFHT